MKVKLAAVLEPKSAERKKIAAALRKAGLEVSPAVEPSELAKEQLVVVGASHQQPAKVAKVVKKALPEVLLLAAQKTLGKAAWADGVLPLPVSPRDLQVRLPELAAVRERAASKPSLAVVPQRSEGILDPLTSFYTFAHFKEVLFVEVKRARRYGFPVGFALIAFDPLGEKLNDELRSTLFGGLALAIRRSLRDTDYPVQSGPDRVMILMPHTDLAGSLIVSRRIVERVGRATLSANGKLLRPTISAGVAAATAKGGELAFSDLVRHAQSALDEAQRSGGNKVEFWDPAAQEGQGALAEAEVKNG